MNSTYYKVTKKPFLAMRTDVGTYGEYCIFKLLKSYENKGAKFLFNVYLPKGEGETTEIDVLMICSQGIYVFESKNYSGWIFGSEDQLKWTQCFKSGQREHFYNPIKQNRTHIKALATFLNMPEDAFSSYIVFSERCELKKIPLFVDGDVTILQRQNMLYFLKRRLKDAPIIYSHKDIEQVVGLLEPFTEVSQEEKQQHIEDLQTKCPYCGKPLVLRNGKYGQFWGCSAYPKCRFTRKAE